jgi:hypothetical protein
MATYVNDLRLKEITTGDESGTWGTSTNTNLELIAEAFSYGTEVITTNADTHTTTIADGATDPGRSLYLKYTGTLDSACTITIGPDTVSKVWIIENGTSGSQDIILSQGSGANITIPAGDTKVVYSDGAGAGAAFFDAFASLSVVDLKVQDDLTVTDDASIGGDATITGTLGVTGVFTGTSLDISGDIDVDGTTNLDVVDIDGAVDMASTALVTGVLTANGGAVFNEAGADVDFRVESDTVDHALFVQGSDGNVGIGTDSPDSVLHVSDTSQPKITIEDSTNNSFGRITGGGSTGSLTFEADFDNTKAGTVMAFNVDNTERMRIDDSGNVGIGVSSPSGVGGRIVEISSANTISELHITNSTSGSGSATGLTHLLNGVDAYAYNRENGAYIFGSNNTEAMRINSSGALELTGDSGAGTTFLNFTADSNATKAQISGAKSGASGGDLIFSTNNSSAALTERMRIDASGQVGIGCSPGVKLAVAGTGTIGSFSSAGLSSSATLQVQAHNGAGYDARLYFECPGSNSGGLTYERANSRLYAYSQSEFSGPYVVANGTSWTTGSDIRLKTNIEDINYGITSVMALSPKKYNYINNADKKCLGFIAQEVINILPELIDTPEDSETMMGIEYQAFIPVSKQSKNNKH